MKNLPAVERISLSIQIARRRENIIIHSDIETHQNLYTSQSPLLWSARISLSIQISKPIKTCTHHTKSFAVVRTSPRR
jgi:hypothetical protein